MSDFECLILTFFGCLWLDQWRLHRSLGKVLKHVEQRLEALEWHARGAKFEETPEIKPDGKWWPAVQYLAVVGLILAVREAHAATPTPLPPQPRTAWEEQYGPPAPPPVKTDTWPQCWPTGDGRLYCADGTFRGTPSGR